MSTVTGNVAYVVRNVFRRARKTDSDMSSRSAAGNVLLYLIILIVLYDNDNDDNDNVNTYVSTFLVVSRTRLSTSRHSTPGHPVKPDRACSSTLIAYSELLSLALRLQGRIQDFKLRGA